MVGRESQDLRRRSVNIYGSGSIGTRVHALLSKRRDLDVRGPYGRNDREMALSNPADLVIIATSSFLEQVAPDVRQAVSNGSNVLTTAEEAAYPSVASPQLATELDRLARDHSVTVLGAGVNPGLAFDALVLTLAGTLTDLRSIRISRTVDLSGWGKTVLMQLGVGHPIDHFQRLVSTRAITGHIGWLESATIIAERVGQTIVDTTERIEPILARSRIAVDAMVVEPGESAGFRQEFVASTENGAWYTAEFIGHIDPGSEDLQARNSIDLEGSERLTVLVDGFKPQSSTANLIANSVDRVIEATPGWLTVADLPPATPSS